MKRTIVTLSVAFYLVTRGASATSNFPAAIKSELALQGAPACSLCHQGTERRGTVTTPFGTRMRARGLVAYDETSLRTALAALAAEKTDSDADGTPDITELSAGTDPNTNADTDAVGPPEYGCSVRPSDNTSSALVLATTLVALALSRRRHATHRKLTLRLKP